MKGIFRTIGIVAFLLMATTVQAVSATDVTINLCEKTINVGNSWGVCPDVPTGAYGTFTYANAGPTFAFTASASGLSLADGTEASLLYYKDSDANHVLPSTKNVNVLATGIVTGGSVSFSGSVDIGNIPAVDDINPRGKIWIVPTSEINPDYTLKWTGYGNGLVMDNYLFESDSTAQLEGDGLTVQDRMGGITYTKVVSSSDSLTGSVYICGLPTIGVDVTETSINFGSLYPGESSASKTINAAITQTAQQGCALTTVDINVEVVLGVWNTPEMSTVVTNPNVNPITSSTASTSLSPIGFVATAGPNVVPGTYSQTITLSATF